MPGTETRLLGHWFSTQPEISTAPANSAARVPVWRPWEILADSFLNSRHPPAEAGRKRFYTPLPAATMGRILMPEWSSTLRETSTALPREAIPPCAKLHSLAVSLSSCRKDRADGEKPCWTLFP